jgi:hypothetical protein
MSGCFVSLTHVDSFAPVFSASSSDLLQTRRVLQVYSEISRGQQSLRSTFRFQLRDGLASSYKDWKPSRMSCCEHGNKIKGFIKVFRISFLVEKLNYSLHKRKSPSRNKMLIPTVCHTAAEIIRF